MQLSLETDQRSNCWSTPRPGSSAQGSRLLCPRVQEHLEQFRFPVTPVGTTLLWEGPGILMVTRVSATFNKEAEEKNVPLGKGKRITAGSSWAKVGFELTLAKSHPNKVAERAQHVQSSQHMLAQMLPHKMAAVSSVNRCLHCFKGQWIKVIFSQELAISFFFLQAY